MMKVDYMSHSGNDLLVVDAARCSFDKASDWDREGDYVLGLKDSDKRLLDFLAREGHWLPFRHPTITFRIYAPLFVLRQLDKHQVGFSTSEVSRRYITGDPEFHEFNWRQRPEGSIKQGSGEEFSETSKDLLNSVYFSSVRLSMESYKRLLDEGVAPEQARAVLPQSMYTTQVKTGSLLGWMNMYKLRADAHAQKEIQRLADLILPQLMLRYPESVRAIRSNS